jgi:hypothetical protein
MTLIPALGLATCNIEQVRHLLSMRHRPPPPSRDSGQGVNFFGGVRSVLRGRWCRGVVATGNGTGSPPPHGPAGKVAKFHEAGLTRSLGRECSGQSRAQNFQI